jgi:hypothetical protein
LESSAAKAGVKSPFQLRFKLATFGGAKIDPESVKVTYLKKPPVDLTDRFGKITQADGLELAAAAAPAGTHHIRVTVQDSAGRERELRPEGPAVARVCLHRDIAVTATKLLA